MERADPELRFRGSPKVSEFAMLALVDKCALKATVRLGARDEWHFKGYAVGEGVVIRVKDTADNDLIVRRAHITDVIVKRLHLLAPEELADTLFYKSWREALHDLVYFEKRPIDALSLATIVRFEYVAEEHALDPEGVRRRFPGCFLIYPPD